PAARDTSFSAILIEHDETPLHFYLFLPLYAPHRDFHSFPTRRSSDLDYFCFFVTDPKFCWKYSKRHSLKISDRFKNNCHYEIILDRKSTRLNSSHVSISYAVFCLKKTTYS